MNDVSAATAPNIRQQRQLPGLVWAFHAEAPSDSARELRSDELEMVLASGKGWVWLHVDLVDQRIHGWLGQICELTKGARHVLEGHDLGLCLGHETGLLHGISSELHGELLAQSNTIGRLHFAVTDNLLVTGRRHPLASVQEVREALVADELRPASAFELFGMIMTTFGRNVGLRLAEARKQLDKVEDHLVTERLNDERHNLKQVRRLAVSLHRPIAALVALFQSEDLSNWKLSSEAHKVLGQLANRLSRLDHEIVMLNDRARLLQEELSAELADESNRSLRALAIMSALLLPGTLIVGIFGMNTAGLPLTSTPGGFEIAMVLGLSSTGLFYWLLRRAGLNVRL